VPLFIDVLFKEPFQQIARDRAYELLRSSNPWLTSLALARLQAGDAVLADDFAIALQERAPEDAERVLLELLEAAISDQSLRSDLPRALESMIRTPAHQREVLKAVNKLLPTNGFGIRSQVELRQLQEIARKYRDDLPNDAETRPLLAELDQLIRFQPPK
jgi:hypothetical protein